MPRPHVRAGLPSRYGAFYGRALAITNVGFWPSGPNLTLTDSVTDEEAIW